MTDLPGTDTIREALGLDQEKAEQVRDVLMRESTGQVDAEQAMEEINDILGLFGVVALTGDYHVDRYYFNIVALYLNTGDTYNTTVLYETETETFHLVSWGDWVEQNQEKYRIV